MNTKESALLSLVAVLSLAPALPGIEVTYSQYRFLPTELRDGSSANSVQLSEVEFYRGGALVIDAVFPVVTNPGGSSPQGEEADNVIDQNTETKWLDFSKGGLVFDFGTAVTIDGYSWATANDADERDPVSWVLSGSDDGVNWVPVDVREDYPTPTACFEYLPELAIPATTPPVVNEFAIDPPIVLEAQSVTVSWQTGGAESVTLLPGFGDVEADGSRTFVPSGDADYVLSVSNGVGEVEATAKLLVREAGVATFRYYRFVPEQLRDDAAANSIQLAELAFFRSGSEVIPLTASNPGGVNPVGEGPANAVDGDEQTKWLDFDREPLVVDFGVAEAIDSYRLTTANDSAGRDPVSWRLEGSDNEFDWVTVDTIEGFVTPLTRFMATASIPIGVIKLPPVIERFEADFPIALAGEAVTLRWEVAGADSLVLNPGGSPVVATGSADVVVGSGAQTYSLVATNGDGDTVSTTVVTGESGRPVTYQFFRWTPTMLRDDSGANSVQLAEIEFLFEGAAVRGGFATNPFGANPGNGLEDAERINDDDVLTKWLDFNRTELEFDFGGPVTIDRYRLATANDFDGRDPIAWSLEGSDDGFDWELIQEIDGYPTPLERNFYTPEIPFSGMDGGGGMMITAVSLNEVSGELTLTWNSSLGRAYRVFKSTDLVSWVEESDLLSQGSETSATVTVDSDAYYRVEEF